MRPTTRTRERRTLKNQICSDAVPHCVLVEPQGVPSLPSPGTLQSAVLRRLLTGERLTQVTFRDGWRLAAYVLELRRLGWPVRVALMKSPMRKKPIAEYWLDPDAIVAARTAGRPRA